ncbi:hypothetical protein [Chitinophaga sp. S165]|uniref:hypothetical protein n=1 Tax=Chitinophaga sp. S165 TaxID=2135462 RepID=UPI000D70D11C|nr:hypothetical protein [Chitinophaga sp. S165]PWV56558.1 hypothetical protein C7475_1011075 [Chitinophaga sp. S165]
MEQKERKYQLTVKGNVKMLTMMDSFATVGIYELQWNGQNASRPELQEYVLEEKEVRLTEYFDPNTYQLIEYVNKLARIYNRQHICINKDGQIKGLLNLPEIKGKWDAVKKELMQVNPIAAFEIIRHKDRELDAPVEVIENLANTHFMQLFLYDWGIRPGGTETTRRQIVRDRMGIGFFVPVVQTFGTTQQPDGYSVQVEAILDGGGRIDKGMITLVTGQQELDIKHYTRASFQHDGNGVLLSADMTVFEQLTNDCRSDLYLHLESIS